MKKLAIVSALLATLAGVNVAHAYQTEVNAGISVIDVDGGDQTTAIAAGGTYYLAPVDVKNYPLAEAAFMNRASNVNAAVGYGKNDDVKVTTLGAGIEYYVPNSDFYASANAARNEVKFAGEKESDNLYSAEVGILPMPNLLVAVGVAGNSDNTDPTLRAKYVYKVGANDVNLEANASFGDLDQFGIGADYYIDRTLSVGAAYSDDGNDDSFGIRARKFITQDVSIQGSVDFGNDVNVFGVAGTYRF